MSATQVRETASRRMQPQNQLSQSNQQQSTRFVSSKLSVPCQYVANEFFSAKPQQNVRPESKTTLPATTTPLLRIKQTKSKFTGTMELSDDALSTRGNKILNITQGDIEQEGSTFGGDIKARGRAKVQDGNRINGQIIEDTTDEL